MGSGISFYLNAGFKRYHLKKYHGSESWYIPMMAGRCDCVNDAEDDPAHYSPGCIICAFTLIMPVPYTEINPKVIWEEIANG